MMKHLSSLARHRRWEHYLQWRNGHSFCSHFRQTALLPHEYPLYFISSRKSLNHYLFVNVRRRRVPVLKYRSAMRNDEDAAPRNPRQEHQLRLLQEIHPLAPRTVLQQFLITSVDSDVTAMATPTPRKPHSFVPSTGPIAEGQDMEAGASGGPSPAGTSAGASPASPPGAGRVAARAVMQSQQFAAAVFAEPSSSTDDNDQLHAGPRPAAPQSSQPVGRATQRATSLHAAPLPASQPLAAAGAAAATRPTHIRFDDDSDADSPQRRPPAAFSPGTAAQRMLGVARKLRSGEGGQAVATRAQAARYLAAVGALQGGSPDGPRQRSAQVASAAAWAGERSPRARSPLSATDDDWSPPGHRAPAARSQRSEADALVNRYARAHPSFCTNPLFVEYLI